MSRTIFAKPDTNEQTIDLRESPVCPDGFIKMQAERPEQGDYIAQADGTWLEVVASLDETKAAKLKEINDWADQTLSKITSAYPHHEVVSWDKQEAEARKFLLDSGAYTPLLDALAAARGIDKAELCQRVVVKAELFQQLTGQVFGQRQKLEDLLDQADSVEAVEAIEVTQ
ncbi:hypothetical protein [Endozoicomonas sp. ALB091]|uniref:hypothetical protein n=1 Tax=Endozoicomonas sp. ALB091 TaxID=3403073 RepID=UPI003BB73B6C